MFQTNPYGSYAFYYNSSTNSRGVGILIKTNLNVSVRAEARDSSENILALQIQTQGAEFVICAVYGPNKLCPDFFTDLNNIFSNASKYPIIVRGDWNCTPCLDPATNNIDVRNMNSLPSIQHSRLLNTLMSSYCLTDLYRCFYPRRKDFTFIPKCKDQSNRSRIDFILLSESIVNFSHNCDIAPSVPNSLFDHKSTFVNFF